ncbi:MAG: putative oxidoreductase SadH [Stenotrophomonas maltophilia]|uniref:Putative oxidoreductase SadH n=1 Tax=Stenotrophomonas maltophilia TaxID=40324 RepID=A0A7V8FGR2_STEMA|nr:MAG: putative oxidoreductase SadH [Stenotrophomonas maltophilia]
MSHNNVWFITGVSSGFGRELAIKALAAGDRVAGTLRNEAQRVTFETLHAERAHGVLLDVTDEAAITPVVAGVVAAHGRIDVLVNNAGYGMEGAVEETSMAQARRQFDVNFFGALAVTQAVLPVMRAQRSGHILNITSMGGLISFPGLGIYNASKHALEGLSDALAQEVAPLGIQVTAIEPGPFRTEWAGRSMEHAAARIEDYQATAGAMTRSLEQRNGRQAGDPARAADAMLAVVASAQPPRRLLLGSIGFKQVGEVMAQRQAEMIRWADLTLSADYPPGE